MRRQLHRQGLDLEADQLADVDGPTRTHGLLVGPDERVQPFRRGRPGARKADDTEFLDEWRPCVVSLDLFGVDVLSRAQHDDFLAPARDVQAAVLLARLVHRDHVRVIDRRCDLGLTHEPVTQVGVRGEVRGDQLQGDGASERDLRRSVDDAHAPAAQLADEAVRPDAALGRFGGGAVVEQGYEQLGPVIEDGDVRGMRAQQRLDLGAQLGIRRGTREPRVALARIRREREVEQLVDALPAVGIHGRSPCGARCGGSTD